MFKVFLVQKKKHLTEKYMSSFCIHRGDDILPILKLKMIYKCWARLVTVFSKILPQTISLVKTAYSL